MPHSQRGISLSPQRAWDRARDAGSYAPYEELLGVAPQQLANWIEALRVQPVSSIEWQWSAGWSVGPRVINDSMWFWFEDGGGWGWVGDKRNYFRFAPGDLMLIPQGAPHMVCHDEGDLMRLVAVHFHAHVYGGINILDLAGFPAHIPYAKNAPFKDASQLTAREFAVKAPGWTTVMAAEIFGVLAYLLRQRPVLFHVLTGRAHKEVPRLLPALEMIDRRLTDPALPVGDLARAVCLSEVQFRKLFHRMTGLSPVRFIQKRRIERACVLLRSSEMTIEQIAEACGFSDLPFFYRVFKAWTNAAPGSYRKAQNV